ncbi:MAG TPA: DUF1579 family protein [Flavitalea sp.]|nr:DUF1579 family protein [Flavitalea sp.]
MKPLFLFMIVLFVHGKVESQSSPCGSDPVYRQFDFWLGSWEAFGPKGQKAGHSKVSLILDSCIVLEEWTSATMQRNVRFQGKSFNTYNAQTKQWQQTWVDNTGSTTHYLKGRAETNKIIFETVPSPDPHDTTGTSRLSFFKLDEDKVRQLGELSKDNGKTWTTQYDLEYRRKKTADR